MNELKNMKIKIYDTKTEMGKNAAITGAKKIIEAINKKGSANIILATGASQFEMLDHLVNANVDWSKVTCFHLDEYIGLSENHPASFRKYLRERFADKIKVNEFFFINGEVNAEQECLRLNKIISQRKIDVAFIGMGENGHLAFNDPPADFETDEPYIIVDLDKDCRMQQFNEGWFENYESVPKKAISMSIKQILKSELIICTVPDRRKAEAVYNTLKKEIDPLFPSTVLQNHKDTILLLDKESASLIES
jgi:glucosamine-6-phosphate deaminase